MSAFWQGMADSLRAELAEYGRLLQLFEEQQALLLKRDAPGVRRVTDAIDEQVEVVVECRRNREKATGNFARAHGMPDSSTLRSLIPLVLDEARPLMDALVADMNHMVSRLRRISRHNRLFLIRTIETHQEILKRIRPGSFTKIYSPNGRVTVAPFQRVAAFAAEG
ncbi:MAG TPA: flagellar protein FlgN [Opitutaceae bacterium]|nr:flagellar protein FlgN [Opitutaceae bacterium]